MIITRKELNKRYSISHNVWANKHDELMLHLQEYMDITETKSSTGRYTYEIKGEMPDIIPSLRTAQTKQKKKDYEKFTSEEKTAVVYAAFLVKTLKAMTRIDILLKRGNLYVFNTMDIREVIDQAKILFPEEELTPGTKA